MQGGLGLNTFSHTKFTRFADVTMIEIAEETPSFLVNTDDDLNDGVADLTHTSLREAIIGANAQQGRDLIRFRTPADGPHPITINLNSALPA